MGEVGRGLWEGRVGVRLLIRGSEGNEGTPSCVGRVQSSVAWSGTGSQCYCGVIVKGSSWRQVWRGNLRKSNFPEPKYSLVQGGCIRYNFSVCSIDTFLG